MLNELLIIAQIILTLSVIITIVVISRAVFLDAKDKDSAETSNNFRSPEEAMNLILDYIEKIKDIDSKTDELLEELQKIRSDLARPEGHHKGEEQNIKVELLS